MRGTHVAAAIAFVLTAHCFPIPREADASGPVIVWQMRGTQWVPVMSFGDDQACARAAQRLAERSGTYFSCADALSPVAPQAQQHQPASRHKSKDVIEE